MVLIDDAHSNDPLAQGFFELDEAFESLFSGLKGVYFRLYWKESNKPAGLADAASADRFYKRFEEMGLLKAAISPGDRQAKRQALGTYSEELRNMLQLELSEYTTR